MNSLRQCILPSLCRSYATSIRSVPASGIEVKVVEVGPRDGLQNEKNFVSTADKISLIEQLADCGLPVVEAGSFVSPKWVPQMANSLEVMIKLRRRPNVTYPVLVPNLKGLELAYSGQADHIAVFAAASESFSQKNINCSIADSLARFKDVCLEACKLEMRIRGYVSCVLGCPYEQYIRPTAVAKVTEALFEMGCEEVSLGDTIGVGTAGSMGALLTELKGVSSIGMDSLAVHCHDTYGQALANVLVALNVGVMGVRTVDSSVAGLGGCPYAAGASGNLATEDLVYMLHGIGANTGVNLNTLITVGAWISSQLGRTPASKVTVAELAKLAKQCSRAGG